MVAAEAADKSADGGSFADHYWNDMSYVGNCRMLCDAQDEAEELNDVLLIAVVDDNPD